MNIDGKIYRITAEFVVMVLRLTTGGGFFAECLRHSAKADIHSANPLPSVTLGKGRSVNS